MKYMRKLSLIVLFLFLLTFVSAIDITPSNIEINAFPGETKGFNVTIETNELTAVWFNTTNFTILNQPMLINGIEEVTLLVKIPSDVNIGLHNFDIQIFNSQEVVTKTIIQNSGGGGGGYTIKYINNETEVIKEIYINNTQEIDDLNDEIDKLKSQPIDVIPLILIIIFSLYVGALIGLGLIMLLDKKQRARLINWYAQLKEEIKFNRLKGGIVKSE